jgi:hypothetical protein
MSEDKIQISPGAAFRVGMAIAIVADALQLFLIPLFGEGALAPADDALDLAVAGVLVYLLGWHWEFLPAFFGELIPGVDLVPFWTMAVANVYRKKKLVAVEAEKISAQHSSLPKST